MRWIAFALLILFAIPAHAQVTITPTKIIETRAGELLKKDDHTPFWHTDSLTLTLQISGPEIKGVAAYGQLKLSRAVDDLDTNLIPKKESIFGTESRFVAVHEIVEPAERALQESFEAEIELAATPRKATKIAHLTGAMTVLAGGEGKTFDIVDPLSKRGQKITDAGLASAGLAASIPTDKELEKTFSFDDGKNITLKLTGDLAAIREVDVLDASGKTMNEGHSASDNESTRTFTLFLSEKPDAKTIIRISYVVGQKSVSVPFDLKDIPLP